MHFKDISYVRPDADAACARIAEFARRIVGAGSTGERLHALAEYEAFHDELITALTVGQLRYYLNTLDPERAAEMAFIGEIAPRLETADAGVSEALLDAPDREGLARALGAFFFERAEAERGIASPVNENLQIEEQALVQEYTSLVSRGTLEFEGKQYALSAMARFFADPDRDRRKNALLAYLGWYAERAEDLDGIFDSLVKNRAAQAKNLGYETYTELRYRTRFGYGRREIDALRARVLGTWLPLLCRVKERQRARLSVESFRAYDSAMRFADGNPKLTVKRRAFVDAATAMLDRLDEGAGAHFRTLDENGMLDLFDRRGKVPYAGFCFALPAYGLEFLCARFTGEQTDLEVLTHEFGHAFAFHRAFVGGVRPVLRTEPQEISETHSKAMELLTMPHCGLFFGAEDARRYRVKQLEYIVHFLVSICAGDEFQHEIYDHPEMTPAERNAAYERVHRKYHPYMDFSDLPQSAWGGMWQDTLVYYSMPFYFIDYALAQLVALQFYEESLMDFDGAWRRYLRFLDRSGALPFPELVGECGLLSPFHENCPARLAAFLERELDGA